MTPLLLSLSFREPFIAPLEPLDKFRELAGDEAAESGILVCWVEQPQPLPQGNLALPWQRFPAWLRLL